MRRELDRNIRLGKPANFDTIRVKKETRHYVPKLIALSNIFADPARFGVTIPEVLFAPAFATVWTSGSVNIAETAKLTGMRLKDFKALNPGFKRNSSPPKNRARLLVPVDKANALSTALESTGSGGSISGGLIRAAANSTGDRKRLVHRVRAGDTLSEIATRYRVYTDELAAWNAMELDDILQTGQRLVIYHR